MKRAYARKNQWHGESRKNTNTMLYRKIDYILVSLWHHLEAMPKPLYDLFVHHNMQNNSKGLVNVVVYSIFYSVIRYLGGVYKFLFTYTPCSLEQRNIST